jgi:predicted naringenin-chalcone synthase
LIKAYVNEIATAVPPHQVHNAFVHFKRAMLNDYRKCTIFDRLVEKAQIEKRWSCVVPAEDWLSASINGEPFYVPGEFPSTAARMKQYEIEAPVLAQRAINKLDLGDRKNITHLVVTSCTGFSAPGIDLEIMHRLGLSPTVERTVVGFMGCYAAINALKLAHHIVRSEPKAKVLLVSIELCTLHFQETRELDKLVPFILFSDGCAAALISSEPSGVAIESFYSSVLHDAADQMAWHIGDMGFSMVLSPRIPSSVAEAIAANSDRILGGKKAEDIELWAVHPGGRAILDGVEMAMRLPASALRASRKVLQDFGNMSSATVLFVLKALIEEARAGALGCAMSFGPGLTAETMLFKAA